MQLPSELTYTKHKPIIMNKYMIILNTSKYMWFLSIFVPDEIENAPCAVWDGKIVNLINYSYSEMSH